MWVDLVMGCLFVLEVCPCMYRVLRNSGGWGINYSLGKQQEPVSKLLADITLLKSASSGALKDKLLGGKTESEHIRNNGNNAEEE